MSAVASGNMLNGPPKPLGAGRREVLPCWAIFNSVLNLVVRGAYSHLAADAAAIRAAAFGLFDVTAVRANVLVLRVPHHFPQIETCRDAIWATDLFSHLTSIRFSAHR
jgi:hypothetical protein